MKKKKRVCSLPAAGTRVHGLLKGLTIQATLDLKRMPNTPEPSIHAIRTRMKKFRSIWRLARRSQEKERWKPISALARDIKDAFDGLRNRSVMQRLVRRISQDADESVISAATVAPLIVTISGKLRSLNRLVSALSLRRLSWGDVCRAYVSVYREGRRAMKRSKQMRPDELHEWRKRVKDFHYQSLGLRLLGGMKKRIRLARHLGSRIGKHRDLATLDAMHPKKDFHPEVTSKMARLEHDIRTIGRKLYSKSPAQLRRTIGRRLAGLGH